MQHSIASPALAASINADGAELCSLRTSDGTEFIWQAGPIWPRHAPVLFPIVGRLKGDTLRHNGQAYRMTQHGFARDRIFDWVEREATSCRLALTDDAQTRASYPFAFRLELAYEVSGTSLTQTFAVTNTGDEMLPASFGAHPAFIWPLRPDVPKDAHTVTFSHEEKEPIRRLEAGLLLPDPIPTPIQGDTLPLSEGLFAHDALILDHPASLQARYSAPGTPSITVSWSGMRQLGIWTKPDDFLCIEPWNGLSSPQDFDGEFADKLGIQRIPPGATMLATIVISISSNPD